MTLIRLARAAPLALVAAVLDGGASAAAGSREALIGSRRGYNRPAREVRPCAR